MKWRLWAAPTPKPVALEELVAGDVGFVVANIKRVADARMGGTVTQPVLPPPVLPGFEAIKPMVFAGLFPPPPAIYENLRDAPGKLQLNDAASFYEPENSVALGFGFRCGFLLAAAHGNCARSGSERFIRYQLYYDRAERSVTASLTTAGVVMGRWTAPRHFFRR